VHGVCLSRNELMGSMGSIDNPTGTASILIRHPTKGQTPAKMVSRK
jgi:hypothetical protein